MITIKHDHKLHFPTITVPMISQDEEDNTVAVQQTNVEGILVPLFRFNNLTINFQMVQSMELHCDPVPEIILRIHDMADLIKNLDNPGLDNILYMQILPPFDNAYKKVQLMFRVYETGIEGSVVGLKGTYMCPGLWDTKMKAYGRTTTWKLFEEVSNEMSLGFASNVDASNDERYIYNPNMNVPGFLDREIRFGGDSNHVLDWWIDLWNNVNVVDIYEEYNTLREEQDMKIWINPLMRDVDKGSVAEPQQMTAAFSNHPTFMGLPMFIADYHPVMTSGDFTDCNFETYSMDNQECSSLLVQDGDVKENVILKYIYGGENFGGRDYLGQRVAREMFRTKIWAQCIEVSVPRPILGLIKGDKVNVWWYDINSYMTEKAADDTISSNSTIPESVQDTENSFIINPTISGQYYIIDFWLEYDISSGWKQTFRLGRSADSIQRINGPTNETFNK